MSVEDDMTVTIHPQNGDDARRLARRLLKAAGRERHDEVRTTTGGAGGLAFDVPADLADRVFGLGEVSASAETLRGGPAEPPTPDESETTEASRPEAADDTSEEAPPPASAGAGRGSGRAGNRRPRSR